MVFHNIVVKQGSKGATLIEPSGLCYTARSQPLRKPVDTTGAGDAFNAFLLLDTSRKRPKPEDINVRCNSWCFKVGYRGSILVYDEKTILNTTRKNHS